MPKPDTLAHADRADLTLTNHQQPGPVYTFVPAHGEPGVGAVQSLLNRAWTEDLELTVLLADFSTREHSVWEPAGALRRLDGRTFGAFVRSEDGGDVLDAHQVDAADLGRLLDHARRRYNIVSVDLTGARETHALEVFRVSTSIFLVAGSDRASLESAAEKVAWLRALGLEERGGMLLRRVEGGLRPDLAEDLAGVPVCGVVEDDTQLRRLAHWLGSKTAMRMAGAL